MNADQVRALVAAKFPGVLDSPLAQAMHGASAMAQLEASDADAVALRGEAMAHAEACLRASGGWTVETLGHNIESAFGMDLDADECDDIARAAIAKTEGPWYVVTYDNGHGPRETVQNRTTPLDRPSFCFNTEVGHGQRKADELNAAERGA